MRSYKKCGFNYCTIQGEKIIHSLSNYINERYTFWHRWIGALKETQIPTKIVWAKNDPVAIDLIAELLALEIHNNKLFWINECGHFPMLEKPEEWTELILNKEI
jgi:pimeloyl-ACP methyl ester carboxylesterase